MFVLPPSGRHLGAATAGKGVQGNRHLSGVTSVRARRHLFIAFDSVLDVGGAW
jgi:hypothetical protein